jgi:glycosyltransferase involved in cell wall biosynthesis
MANRICFLTTSYPRYHDDEASVFLKRLIEGYAACGASGFVIVPRDKDEPLSEQAGAFSIVRFGYGIFRRGALAFGAGIMPNLRRNPLLILQAPMLLSQLTLKAIRLRKHYDVIHANWALALLAAWAVSIVTGKPYVVTLRGEDIPLIRKPVIRLLCSRALKGAAKVVSVNQNFIGQVQETSRVQASKCEIIPNGVEVPPVSTEEADAFLSSRHLERGKFLLFVGSVIPRKRVDLLLRMLSLPALRTYRLVICGRLADLVYLEQLREIAAQTGVADRVQFEGAVGPSKIPSYLAGAAAYVSASEFEGRPNAVLEALAAGKIVVASNIPAHLEIIEDGDNGFLFPANTLSEANEIFAKILADQGLRRRVGEQAKASVSKLTWKATSQAYLNIFNNIRQAD